MTLDEIKQRRSALAEQIAVQIRQFEQDTGVIVMDIDMTRLYLNDEPGELGHIDLEITVP